MCGQRGRSAINAAWTIEGRIELSLCGHNRLNLPTSDVVAVPSLTRVSANLRFCRFVSFLEERVVGRFHATVEPLQRQDFLFLVVLAHGDAFHGGLRRMRLEARIRVRNDHTVLEDTDGRVGPSRVLIDAEDMLGRSLDRRLAGGE